MCVMVPPTGQVQLVNSHESSNTGKLSSISSVFKNKDHISGVSSVSRGQEASLFKPRCRQNTGVL